MGMTAEHHKVDSLLKGKICQIDNMIINHLLCILEVLIWYPHIIIQIKYSV